METDERSFDEPPPTMSSQLNGAPAVIAPNHGINDVRSWFPASVPVLKRFGIEPSSSVLQQLFGRERTIAQAALERQIPLEKLLLALNEVRAQQATKSNCRGCRNCECGKSRTEFSQPVEQ